MNFSLYGYDKTTRRKFSAVHQNLKAPTFYINGRRDRIMFEMLMIAVFVILVCIIISLIYKNRSYKNRISGQITAAILTPEELEKHAREIAGKHSILIKSRSCAKLLPRMEENYRFIIRTYKELNRDIINGEQVIPAAEWLFDNFYVIEEQIKEIRLNFPKGYHAVLPCLASTLLKGFPRIYGIILELISHTDGRVDERVITDFIKSYQSKSQLTSGELWAVPIILKIALLENIRSICEDILASQRERSEADRLADMILANENDENIVSGMRFFSRDMDTLSSAFAEQLLKRMRRHGAELGPIMHYIDERLASQDTTASEIIQAEHQDQAQKQVSMGNSITSLRLISSMDWNEIFESLSPVEQVLRSDPAGIYQDMDFASRDYYRHIVEYMARRLNISESQVARKAVECAESVPNDEDARIRHVGYYLIGRGRDRLKSMLSYRPGFGKSIAIFLKRHPAKVYLFSIIILTLGFTWGVVLYARVMGTWWVSLIAGLISLLPASEISTGIVNWIITHILTPSFLPKQELKDGIPEEYASMVVIPALLPDKSRVDELLQELEVYYLANQEDNLYFALLGDFTDARDREMPGDESIIKCAIDGVRKLNHKYSAERPDLFYFFHRPREFNKSQSLWMGWERKRGKLMEFNRMLRGAKDTGYVFKSGDTCSLPQIKYVITLDADTELPRGAAKRLIGTISHPLNSAIVDGEKHKVVQGYGILQPRVSIGVTSSQKTRFSRIFAGQGGIDPYTTAVSDIYMDLFEEGIYTGKGIYDIDVFIRVLDGYIPENAVLSHDLLEGSYTRTGLVTDIELIDGFPAKYSSYAARMHRWVRGDWQLLPWLRGKVLSTSGEYVRNPLSAISKWKIIDNLRRSLIPPFLVILIFLSFWILPGNELFWLGLVALTIAFPIIADMMDVLIAKSVERRQYSVISGLLNILYQIILMFIFLPYRGYLMCDAILRTIGRLVFTKRNMLEWETAADAEKRLRNDLKSYISRMWISEALSLLLIIAARLTFSMWFPAAIIASLWIVSPFVAYWVSQAGYEDTKVLSEEDKVELRLLCRKTWRYFEEFMGPSENYLPPDNYQEEPDNGVAHRTSPTNIGLGLMAVLTARDFGFISTVSMIERLEHMFSSMDKLDTWKGHFYNWYDTKNLQPLRPLYVSTVDSGNLIGYLMALKEGIREYMHKPVIDNELIAGIKDSLELLNQDTGLGAELKNELGIPDGTRLTPKIWGDILDRLIEKKKNINCDGSMDSSPYSRIIDEALKSFKVEMDEILPWVGHMRVIPDELKNSQGPALEELYTKVNNDLSLNGLCCVYRDGMALINNIISSMPEGCENGIKWLRELKSMVMQAYLACNQILSRSKILMEKCQDIIERTEFKPLFDERRQLFSIGYSAEDEQLNRSYYDLLASESRQTSFISIARGEIDQKHWFRLGRSLTFFDKYRGLVSWSGTMFEYLMPLLIMKDYKNTLLHNTYSFVLKSQSAYGNMRNVPWGVSESGYYAFDANMNYQYKAFGVPRLGLKRGLVNDMVIAPYATILALMVDPYSAMRNLETLREEGVEGPYGFYEAVDYTPERIPVGKKRMIVKSYMVHHHGMSLLAFNNILHNNIMQERFHRDPYVKATELLLQEKVPSRALLTKDIEEEISPLEEGGRKGEEYFKVIKASPLDFPEAHIISNGIYHTVLTNAGSGYSRMGGTAVTRWREDSVQDGYGMFLYIQNINSNNVWSAAYEPYRVMPEEYRVTFSSDKVDFFRTDGSIDTHTEVVVSPEDNTEIRRISLTNHSNHARVLEVTSYFEVVLSSQASDVSHPVFNNLFVRTEFVQGANCLLAARRPRTADQKPLWLYHTVSVEGESIGSVQYETDRMRFIGRNRDVGNPAAMDVDHPLSNTTGAVLDPVMSLRRRVRINTGETVRISYIAGVSDTREEALETALRYSDTSAIKRAFELAWTRSQVETRYLNLSNRDIGLFQRMVSHILYISPLRRAREEILRKNTRGQSGLWPYGISGDVPIVLVRVGKNDEIDLVYQMLKAHEYWRIKGFQVDLVILNEDLGNYMQDLQNKLRNIILSSHGADIQDRPGGVFLRQSGMMSEEGRNLLLSAAKIILRGDGGSIRQQLKYPRDTQKMPEIKAHNNMPYIYPTPAEEYPSLMFFNGIGGFKMDGCEYVITLTDRHNTPAPWVNVVCNESFGFIISESGGGYTWSENSRENKLTPWSNDPVTNLPGEVIYFRDEDDGSFWTTTPMPVREEVRYTVRHGFGYTVFECTSHGIKQEITMFVPADDSIKIMKVKLKNISGRDRSLSAVYYMEPVLGVNPEITSPFIITNIDEKTGVMLIRNTYSDDFPGRVCSMDCSILARTVTGDRAEFLGRRGSLESPEALKYEQLSGHVGAGYDPCAAMQVKLYLKQNEEKIIVFTLGQGKSEEEAVTKASRYRDLYEVEKALGKIRGYWNRVLGTIQVKTPDASLNIMANGWLMYQTISCRIWARSGFYQSGGAYGFRDQLQDVMGAAYVSPDMTRKQLLVNCAHQFLEGDVQHWWHPVTDRGIRTRFSDDLLWLPYVTADYIETTKDTGVLDSIEPYLEDEPLPENEDERYNKPRVSSTAGSLYEHCIKAIDRSLKFGVHGIPLMGSGDWNDGMNTVGNKGRGESVWLGWFLYKILLRFAPLCRLRDDDARAEEYVKAAQDIANSIEKHGWDGSWYRRAYFDNGIPLGSASNSECQIDSLAQSWSIISGGGSTKRSLEAMGALEHYLINRDAGLIMLLTPPFDKGDLEPGYIKGYVPGVRENGGQYTHAAVWVILAYAMLGKGDKAWELFNMINPINHALTGMEYTRYKVEPYVMAADVYAVEPHTGRGGWTWYTGAAGWMYRVCIEHMLGLRLRGDEFEINPCIPEKWKEYSIRYRYHDTLYNIEIKNPSGVSEGIDSIRMDGRLVTGPGIPLVNDKTEHRIEVIMG